MAITDEERNALIQRIGQIMSDISEECWCAAWLYGTEFILPSMFYLKPETEWTWGMGMEDMSTELRKAAELAEQVGTWAVYNSDAFVKDYQEYIAFDPRPLINAKSLQEAVILLDGYRQKLGGYPETYAVVLRDALEHIRYQLTEWFDEVTY